MLLRAAVQTVDYLVDSQLCVTV
uniref:Uncharacterized protein n=1 Tax=Arundo donax TaxID=35708 RepID=A0A0A8YSR5_ARUDO